MPEAIELGDLSLSTAGRPPVEHNLVGRPAAGRTAAAERTAAGPVVADAAAGSAAGGHAAPAVAAACSYRLGRTCCLRHDHSGDSVRSGGPVMPFGPLRLSGHVVGKAKHDGFLRGLA